MLCTVPDGEPFKIQVKGISTANAFYIDKSFFERPIQANLFLVVVLVPPIESESTFRFFVLTHDEAIRAYAKMPKTRRDGRPYESGNGLNWGLVKNYEGAWQSLPALGRG
jgi:hypothetical protein